MKRAFTLVELLVVIGILGILTGILLSTFGGAGDSARATKCLANMRNLAMAVQSYAMSNGGSYPGASGWIAFPSDEKGGSGCRTPYDTNEDNREYSLTKGSLWAACNRSRDCYFCPDHQRYARKNKLGGDPLWSYVMSSSISGSYGSLDRADRVLLFAELPYAEVANGEFTQTGNISGDELDPVLDYKDETDKDSGNECIGFNHKVGRNLYAHVCFADGHVEKLLAPKRGSIEDLTSWLCKPMDADKNDFDVTFDGEEYKKSDATE